MAAKLKLRVEGMPVTQETFAKLPLWMTAAEAKWATGWDDRELAAAVKAAEVIARKNAARRKGCRGNYQKYSKPSIAKAIGWSC